MNENQNYVDICSTVSYPTDYDNGKIDFPYKDNIEKEEDSNCILTMLKYNR